MDRVGEKGLALFARRDFARRRSVCGLKSKSCRDGGRNVICLSRPFRVCWWSCGVSGGSPSCSSMAGGIAGDGANTGMFAVWTRLWRSRPPPSYFDADGFAADRDSESQSCGRLVAIERGRLSQRLGIGLPSFSCKVDVDARLLFVSSWMVKSGARQRGDDEGVPGLGLFFSVLLELSTLAFECGLAGSMARDVLDSARDGPCSDMDKESPLLLLLGKLSSMLARKERFVLNCGRNNVCFAAPIGLALPSSKDEFHITWTPWSCPRL